MRTITTITQRTGGVSQSPKSGCRPVGNLFLRRETDRTPIPQWRTTLITSVHFAFDLVPIQRFTLICRPTVPPSRRRRSNLPKRLDPSRALSESSSNRHSRVPHRSILQRMTVPSFAPFFHLIVCCSTEAWHVVTTVDAFLDSDEEDMDEPARHAYGASSRHPHFMSADPSIT